MRNFQNFQEKNYGFQVKKMRKLNIFFSEIEEFENFQERNEILLRNWFLVENLKNFKEENEKFEILKKNERI